MPTDLELKIALMRADVSLQAIADDCGITRSAVSHILSGRRAMRKDVQAAIVRRTKRRRAELFPDEATA
ncbi:MAG TPA: helix-turn-helix transcriptional regulator [Vicinamibacterales bacterium]|nr:helix-turn-helix transcriptional regulator [Vicinamibacterales bacterium]